VPELLKRQVGPFPVGVWLLIITAGVGIGVVVNRRIGTVDEEPILEPDTGRDEYLGGTGGAQPALAGPTYLRPAPPDTSGPVAFGSNDEWLQAAVRAVATGSGAPLPLTALEALTAFLDGHQLTPEQRAIVNKALGQLGPPPIPPVALPGGGGELPEAPQPTPTVPTAPVIRLPTAPPPTRSPGGVVIDTDTGRPAFTGPSGEGGWATKPDAATQAKYGKAYSWTMPDGRTAWYVPGEHIDQGNLEGLRRYTG